MCTEMTDPTSLEVAELVLALAIRLLPTSQEHLLGAAMSIVDALPFMAAPWIRVTAHNHVPACSIDHLAQHGDDVTLSAIDAYLTLTSARANANRRRISHTAIDNASANGHTQTLSVFLSYLGPKSLPYSTLAIDLASALGHTNALDWWLASPIRPLKYTHHALTDASIHAHVHVLDWWKHSGLVCLYDIFCVLRSASRHGNIQVLRWYREFLDGNLYCPPGVMENAAARGDVAVLEWWTNESKVPLLYKHAMDAATIHGQVNVLQWFVERGPRPLLFSVKVAEAAVDQDVQLWWKQSGILKSVFSFEE